MYLIKSFILFENLNQAKSILKKNGISENDSDFIKIKDLLKDHMGYMGWFSKMFFEENVLMHDLYILYSIIIKESEVISNLPKDIVSYDNWEKLMDDIIKSRNDVFFKRSFNEFPSLQKSFIDIKSSDDRDLLIKLYKCEDRLNFFKKVSRYKSKKDLFDSIKIFTGALRNSGYRSIKDSVVKSGSKIIYDSEDNDIIVCQVDFKQLLNLASDTSWCILSQSTFKSYSNGIDNQYIIFFTDKIGNLSKIGLTYGFKYRTAHAINDNHIGLSEITDMLNDRGMDIKSLKLDLDVVLNNSDSNNLSIDNILNYGISKNDILKYKKLYNRRDLSHFTSKQIEEYRLEDKVIINSLRDISNSDLTAKFIIDNKFRIKFDLNLLSIVRIYPSPNQLSEMLENKLFDSDTIIFVEKLISNRYSILSYMKSNPNFYKEYIQVFIYILKYCGIDSRNSDLSDICDVIYPRKLKIDNFDKLLDYFKESGFKPEDNPDLIFETLEKLEIDRYSNLFNIYLDILDKNVYLKSQMEEYFSKIFDRTKHFDRLDDLREISEISKGILKKHLPDISEKIINKSNVLNSWYNIRIAIPDNRYQGRGVRRTETLRYQNDRKRTGVITPQELYDDFYEDLKNESWPSGVLHKNETLPTLYMIFALCKIDKYEKIGSLKIKWSYDFTGKVIALALSDLNNSFYSSNGDPVIYDNFLLNEEEREKLFTYLLANIKQKVSSDTSNSIHNEELFKHKTFSLVYYIYNWGFNNYFNLVDKSKSVFKDKWSTVNGDSWVEKTSIKIEYFEYIIDYLVQIGNLDDLKDLIDRIMGMEMTPTEVKMSKDYLSYLSFYKGHGKSIEKDLKSYLSRYGVSYSR